MIADNAAAAEVTMIAGTGFSWSDEADTGSNNDESEELFHERGEDLREGESWIQGFRRSLRKAIHSGMKFFEVAEK